MHLAILYSMTIRTTTKIPLIFQHFPRIVIMLSSLYPSKMNVLTHCINLYWNEVVGRREETILKKNNYPFCSSIHLDNTSSMKFPNTRKTM